MMEFAPSKCIIMHSKVENRNASICPNKRAMTALGRSPEYQWNQIIQNLSTSLAEEVV